MAVMNYFTSYSLTIVVNYKNWLPRTIVRSGFQ